MNDKRRQELIAYFQYFGNHHAPQISPLYAKYSHHVARSDYLLELASKATYGQPAANLIFAAVHYLLADRFKDDPLADYYDTLGGSRSYDDGNPCTLFETFIRSHEIDVMALASTRITNTNEIGRCGVLLPAFMMVAQEAATALHMIEIGPSCGLIMCWDKYGYDIGGASHGRAGAQPTISTQARGTPPPLTAALPNVLSRKGLELHKVDIEDPDTLAWQLALIWPGGSDRANRIRQAFDVARSMKPAIIEGDALETIRDVIETLPGDGAICVHQSFVKYQIPPKLHAVLSSTLADLSKKRPIWRVGMEWIDDGARGLEKGDNSLVLSRYKNGGCTSQHLAFCDAHGRWIEWDPQAPQQTDLL